MNDTQHPEGAPSAPTPPLSPASRLAGSAKARFAAWRSLPVSPLTLVVAVLSVLLLIQWWHARTDIRQLRSEVAGRLKSGENISSETKLLATALQDSLREQQAKINVLENKQTEAQSQQIALEQLYQELSKNRDDWALAEIEQVLSTASQQLQLAGNVQGALIALQNADARLARSDKPQFISIRRAISRDQEKLKSLPTVDMTGLALRLDSVIGQIDTIPLLSDEQPALPASPPKVSRRIERSERAAAKGQAEAASKTSEWLGALEDKWYSWTNEMWGEVRQLILVRNVEQPDALMLSPSQSYFVRENLKLRLLNARLALLSRNENAFRNDLIAAQDVITKYFDTRAKHTQSTLAILRQVQGSNLAIEMPTLADSLNAVRGYKAKP